MAMTKKEQAEMDRLRDARDFARALRWPEYAEPTKIPVPDGPFGFHTQGWDFRVQRAVEMAGRPHRSADDLVIEAWSESNAHGMGQHITGFGRSASQGGIELYETRADALRALRLDVTERFARVLATIDAEIAKASD